MNKFLVFQRKRGEEKKIFTNGLATVFFWVQMIARANLFSFLKTNAILMLADQIRKQSLSFSLSFISYV